MFERLAADAVLVVHVAFIVFAVLGGALVWRWRWVMGCHVPAAAWAFWVEATGRLCPLTALENTLRMQAGQAGYSGGFVEHYLVPLIYPAGLTRDIQLLLAAGVVGINLAVYCAVLLTHRQRRARARNEASGHGEGPNGSSRSR